MNQPRRSFLPLAIKRMLDLLVAIAGLVILAPVMAVVAILIRVVLGRPVLFRQVRPGLDEVPFTLLKFRTMREAYDDDGKPFPDNERMTPLGRLLRKTSLDELPQLWNVLRGEMSLVGPRPLLMEYLGRYSEAHRRRHNVRPGITGLAQIAGRQKLLVSERLDLDVSYVDRWSLLMDLSILARTGLYILKTGDAVPERPWIELDDVDLHPEYARQKALRRQATLNSEDHCVETDLQEPALRD